MDKNAALLAVANDWNHVMYLPHELRGDRDVALVALQKSKLALSWLRSPTSGAGDNEALIVGAVANTRDSLVYASSRLKGYPEFMKQIVKINAHALKHASPNIKNDPMVVFAAVKANPDSLEHASEQLKSDRAFVLKILGILEGVRSGAQYGRVLQFASDSLKCDPELVLAAVERDPNALQYAAKALKDDTAFMQQAVHKDGLALKHASRGCKDTFSVAIDAVAQDAEAFMYVSPRLQHDREVALSCAAHCSSHSCKWIRVRPQWRESVRDLTGEGVQDKGLALAAVRTGGMKVLHCVSETLRGDRDFMLAAISEMISQNGECDNPFAFGGLATVVTHLLALPQSWTPLMRLVAVREVAAIGILLGHGADPYAEVDGTTAYDLAKAKEPRPTWTSQDNTVRMAVKAVGLDFGAVLRWVKKEKDLIDSWTKWSEKNHYCLPSPFQRGVLECMQHGLLSGLGICANPQHKPCMTGCTIGVFNTDVSSVIINFLPRDWNFEIPVDSVEQCSTYDDPIHDPIQRVQKRKRK